MDVFISWSGKRSKQIAEILTDWLPQVIQAVNPWMSKDIDKGARWSPEISEKLAQSKIGIICLTPENLHADWILFEAGALSKIKENKVCTFLIELNPADIEQPLAQFQHTSFSKDDVKSLITTINAQLTGTGEHLLPEKTLNSVFEKNWLDLEDKIKSIPPVSKSKTKKQERSDREILEEILELTRRYLTESMHRIDSERSLRDELEYLRHKELERKQRKVPGIMYQEKSDIFEGLIKEYQYLIKSKEMPKEEAREMIFNKLRSINWELSSELKEYLLKRMERV
jgi:hypothetical protein